MLKASLVLKAGMPKNAISYGEDRGEPVGRSSLQQPGLAHPVADALALRRDRRAP